ncbi:MAG: protein translocase subunit SecF [Ruminococcus sp.]|uniref:Protein-export membrane protein SecF n=1 Tax=Ruminococcus bovis TaxID=2564099 RepID=A0A4P8XWI7_9FIRM|nr:MULTISPECIES: protein translocase subunit SecF [Ruminococcus]MCI5598559.1 protein translocase subunit SecF [Ruminococcus sp.]MCI5617761.1 protein translocase subunit SecF [Ruminococcus sp.]MDD5889795.1 protein translocase subunit SecF [Ruminococcus sp.]MDD6531228.1 protein translocase subunit SecF [Ruminococcus sp.]MDD6709969.1 protein translocase subunit SecF [Ruminococcus sp.]
MKNKLVRFTKFSKVFFGISLGIILIGIICNFVFGTQLDIQFRGGSYIKYSYVGDVDTDKLKDVIQTNTKQEVTMSISSDILSNSKKGDAYTIRVEFAGTKAISTNEQKNLTQTVQKAFPDNNFKVLEASAIESSMGSKFLLKCLTAVAIASILMVLYVTIRFRKIGGLSAGVMALVALFHDVAMIYFMYVIFQMPIDSNFIAVVLMILGYSLNDTIVIYDRVREERRNFGAKEDIGYVFDYSATKVLRRTIFTSLTTLIAIGTVLVVSMIFNISSVTSFALPMMIGVISGCYSSVCIAGPLWVMWQKHKKKAKASK